VCGPGSSRAIEILFLDGRNRSFDQCPVFLCECAENHPPLSQRINPASSDDELKVPDACSVARCSPLTDMGHAHQRLIIGDEPDLVAAAESLPHQASRGGDFFPDSACTS